MAIHIVRLGTPRKKNEGIRIGTVRRPPRGVKKEHLATRDFYDTWLPNLAPGEELVKQALGAQTDKDWKTFERRYRAEMKKPESQRILELLATLSHTTSLAVGCYCENESRCHRSILRMLLEEKGARVV
jgi:uncharacterized protein YeaO (DUF488 family)